MRITTQNQTICRATLGKWMHVQHKAIKDSLNISGPSQNLHNVSPYPIQVFVHSLYTSYVILVPLTWQSKLEVNEIENRKRLISQ